MRKTLNIEQLEERLAEAKRLLEEAREYAADLKDSGGDRDEMAEAKIGVDSARDEFESARDALRDAKLGPLACAQRDRDEAARVVARDKEGLAAAQIARDEAEIAYWTEQLSFSEDTLAYTEERLLTL